MSSVSEHIVLDGILSVLNCLIDSVDNLRLESRVGEMAKLVKYCFESGRI